MRLFRTLLLPAALLAAAACHDNGITTNARPPLGGVRFINAVPDGGPVDIRYVDQVQWSGSSVNGTAYGLAFRAGTIHWATEAKARHIRVFPTDSNIVVTSTVLLDTTINVAANKNVTLMLVGSRAPGGKISFREIDDTPPALSASQIAVRVVNATGTGQTPSTASAWFTARDTSTLSATPTYASIGPYATSSYTVQSTGQFAVRTTAAGTTTPVWSTGAPAGAAADGLIAATAGYLGGGSAMSAYIFPRSTAGTAAPQTSAFAAPAVVFFVDLIPAPVK